MMADNVSPMFKPDEAAMLRHLEHLFGGNLDGKHEGKIEIAWRDERDGRLRHGQLFGTDQLEEAAAHAARMNATPGRNVYVGGALRHPDTAPFGRCEDADAWSSIGLWADLDDDGAADAVRHKYRGCPPTCVVVTGRQPHKRAQLWWRLTEAIDDMNALRAQLVELGRALDGDMTVVNPGRVMRLGGSIAWPTKDGRVVERTELFLPDDRPRYLPGQIARAFPPAAGLLDTRQTETPSTAAPAPQNAPTGAAASPASASAPVRSAVTGLISPAAALAKIRAGEQWHNHMIQLVGHWVARGWTDTEILGQAAGITLPGYTIADTTREMRQAIDGARRKLARPNLEVEFDVETGATASSSSAPPDIPISAVTFELRAIEPRQWVLGKRYLIGKVTVTIAPPGVGKSTLTIHEALAVATGQPWAGSEVLEQGAVWIYNNEDDLDELDRRIIAAAKAMDIDPSSLEGRVFRSSGETRPLIVARDMPTGVVRTPDVDACVETIQKLKIKLMVVDPFAETHEVDENDNGAIKKVAMMYREIAQRAGCAISLVHHTRKTPAGSQDSHIGNMDSGRGAGALNGVARIVHTVFGMTEKDADRYGKSEEERHRFIRLDDAKSNLSMATFQASWFQRVSIDLGNGSGFRKSDEVGALIPVNLVNEEDESEHEDDLATIAKTVLAHGEGGVISKRKLAELLAAQGFKGRRARYLNDWIGMHLPNAGAPLEVMVGSTAYRVWKFEETRRGGLCTAIRVQDAQK